MEPKFCLFFTVLMLVSSYSALVSAQKTVACETKTLSIICDKGLKIFIIRANYGRLSRTVCNENGREPIRDTTCVSQNSLEIVINICSGKRHCNVEATNKVFGDPCFLTRKYLEVDYRCVIDRNHLE